MATNNANYNWIYMNVICIGELLLLVNTIIYISGKRPVCKYLALGSSSSAPRSYSSLAPSTTRNHPVSAVISIVYLGPDS